MENKNSIEPYQPYFFSGLLISILGLLVWVFFQLGWLSHYPQQEHAFLMVMGFLFAYVSGFLMTAVPRMSQSQDAQKWEVWTGVALLWLQVSLALSQQIQICYALGALQMAFLLMFVLRRFQSRKARPPMGFVFLPLGLGAGLLGSVLLALPAEWLSVGFFQWAKILLYQAFILNLILGLGTRLIPALTRVQGALDVRAAGAEKLSSYLWTAGLLNLSFVLEAFVNPSVGQLLKFFVIAWLAVNKFKIFKVRQVRSSLGTGIRLAVHLLACGFLLAAVFPNWSLHFLHLSFIGGFALLTFLISTRVVLAHGGYDLSLELKNRNLIFFFSLVSLVAVLRVFMGFEMSSRGVWIGSLSATWLVFLTLWSRDFMARLWKVREK